jgi:hypothetical protein
VVELTRVWTFDAAACTFEVDEFAHVVTDEDKRMNKTTNWYRQLRIGDEQFRRALQKAARDTGKPQH